MTRILTLDQIPSLLGQELGVSEWQTVSQEQIDAFAGATGDRQWIHCDPDRAKVDSPFGGTIAHGFLTLSLCSQLAGAIVRIDGVRQLVNYGLNRVRFPHPVRSGSQVRLRLKLLSLKEQRPAEFDITYECTVEIRGETKPACVAEWILRVYCQ